MDGKGLLRALSWIWSLRAARAEGLSGPLEVRWEQGRKVLNTAHANQSFGSLHRVWRTVFRHLLSTGRPPDSVLLLGLGGGSVVHILRAELGIPAPVTALEMDPAMVAVARAHFGLDTWPDLRVVQGDAIVRVHALRERFDWVVVDLFDDLDIARGADTMAFTHALRDRCAEGGVVCFNTVDHDEESGRRCQRVHDNLARVFNVVEELRTEGVNRVAIAR